LPETRASNDFTGRFNFHEWLFRAALKHFTAADKDRQFLPDLELNAP